MKPASARTKWLPHIGVVAMAVGLAVGGSAQAANPPGWLNWGSGNDSQSDSSGNSGNAQGGSAHAKPVASANADSGQTVVIQNLLNQVQDMQQEIRQLRGKIEVQNNTIERLKSAQRDGFASLDKRMSKLEQGQSGGGSAAPDQGAAGNAGQSAADAAAGGAQAAASNQAAATNGQAAGNASAPAGNGQSQADAAKQQALYNKAFDLLKNGKYKAAVKGFQDVIDADPHGQWTPGALFWQGETYYVLQDRDKAEASYQKVLHDFPKSGRVPDALLKTGYIAYDRKQNDKARQIFKQVIAKYPNSQAANLAKQRLDRMDKEHR